MSPNPRSRRRFPEEESDRRLRTRLDLLIAFMVVQLVISIGLWIDRSDGSDDRVGRSKESADNSSNSSNISERRSVQPDPMKIEEKPRQQFSEQSNQVNEPEKIEPIRIQILNGCGESGIARRAGGWMTRNGYDVRDIDNADRQDYPECLILDRVGNTAAALTLADDLGIDPNNISRQSAGPDPMYDLTIILGKDYKQLPLAR